MTSSNETSRRSSYFFGAGLILATVALGMTGYTVYLANQLDSLIVQETSLQASVDDNQDRASQGTKVLVELRAQKGELNREILEITTRRDTVRLDLDTVLKLEQRATDAKGEAADGTCQRL